MKQEAFSLESGSVKIHGHTILKSVFIQLFTCETIGMLFNNSDEKNAFIKLLSGKIPLHYGRIYIEDRLIHESDMAKELTAAIHIVKYPTSLSKQFTIQENLYYGEFNEFYINSKKFYEQTLSVFEQFNIQLKPDLKVSGLSPFERTIIEILKGYVRNYKVIVLANVTGALDQSETAALIQLIAQLKKLGLSFLIIGAFEEILFEQTDCLSIIQGGRTIGVFQSTDFKAADLHKLLYKYSLPVKEEPSPVTSQKIFSLHNITSLTLDNISLSLHRGEVVKIIYSDDASAKELEAILKGTTKNYSGNIYVNRRLYHADNLQDALKNGIGFIEENPIKTMLFKNLTILDNICYPLSNKINGFWMSRKYQKSVKKTLGSLIDPSYFKKPISEVSIETLYLVLYCKWLLFMPKVLVCINPFSVADLQINQIIDQMIHYLTNRGISVIILTSYWPSFSTVKGPLYYLEKGRLIEQEQLK